MSTQINIVHGNYTYQVENKQRIHTLWIFDTFIVSNIKLFNFQSR